MKESRFYYFDTIKRYSAEIIKGFYITISSLIPICLKNRRMVDSSRSLFTVKENRENIMSCRPKHVWIRSWENWWRIRYLLSIMSAMLFLTVVRRFKRIWKCKLQTFKRQNKLIKLHFTKGLLSLRVFSIFRVSYKRNLLSSNCL